MDPYNTYNYQYYTQPPQKSPNIFKSFVYSFIPEKYRQLMNVKTGSMIGFVTLLMLVVTLIDFALFGISFKGELGDGFPDIVIRDGQLHIDKNFLYNSDGIYVFITDEVDEYSYEEVRALANSGYSQILMAGRDKLAYMRYWEYQEIYFSDIADVGEELVIKDWLKENLLPVLYVFIVIVFVVFFIFRVPWYFLCSAIYLLIGMLIASAFGKRLQAGQIFKIAVYSKVPVFMLALLVEVVSLMHSSMPVFIRIIITIIFMVVVFGFLSKEEKRPYPPEGGSTAW